MKRTPTPSAEEDQHRCGSNHQEPKLHAPANDPAHHCVKPSRGTASTNDPTTAHRPACRAPYQPSGASCRIFSGQLPATCRPQLEVAGKEVHNPSAENQNLFSEEAASGPVDPTPTSEGRFEWRGPGAWRPRMRSASGRPKTGATALNRGPAEAGEGEREEYPATPIFLTGVCA